MRDRLPHIRINLNIDADEFLTRMENISVESGRFEVRRERYEEDFRLLNMRFREASQHHGLIAQVIIDPNFPGIAKLEARAARWEPDPPTYEAYVEAAQNLLNPILETYNRSYHSRLRLSVQSKEDTEPKLPPGASRVFERFVRLANRDALHPTDWERFYHFIWYSASHNMRLNDDDVFRLLVTNGFEEEKALEISGIYYHGFALIKVMR
jgi:hypothetical protein